jgi:mannose-6-phosphate isomerase-like protein (cupin superfamily)
MEQIVYRELLGGERPAWSDVTSAGVFRVEPDGRFDRHFHDCDEYWLVIGGRARILVGERTLDVAKGDIVCIETDTDHDVLGVWEPFEAFWFEAATPPGGRTGHLHRLPEDAERHAVPLLADG